MRAILWDMDGTLLDSEPAHEAAFEAAVAELGLTLPEGFHDTLLGASADQVHAALVAQCGAAIPRADWLARKWRHFRSHASAVERREPTASLVPLLNKRRVPMAVVSNSTADEVDLCLAAAGFDSVFPVCISRADVEHGKPAPEGYLLAARRLGLAPGACMVVEDSLTGARAGLAAGMTVLFHPQANGVAAPEGAVVLEPAASPAATIETFLRKGPLT